MALRASVSRYVGAYPIFRVSVWRPAVSPFHLEIYLLPFPRDAAAIAFYARFI